MKNFDLSGRPEPVLGLRLSIDGLNNMTVELILVNAQMMDLI